MGERGIDADTAELTGSGVGVRASTAGAGRQDSAGRDRTRPLLFGSWLIATLAFLFFLGIGTVPAVLGRDAGEWVGVLDTWRGLGRDLPRVGHATLLRAVFYGAGVFVVLGTIVGLWLAMTATSPDHDATAVDQPLE